MEQRYTERLAKYVIILMTIAIVGAACWYFRSVLMYIILAAVVSLVAHPVFKLLKKCHIKKVCLPDWLAAVLALLIVFAIVTGAITMLVPVVSGVFSDISKASIENLAQAVSAPLYDFNHWVIRTFPSVGRGFKIENLVMEQIQGLVSMSMFSTVIGSLATFVAKLFVALFAVVFISFFFLKKPGLVTSIVTALVPDRYEESMRESLAEIGTLISRYFVGLVTEVLGVSLLNFLGLLLIARMGFRYSIGIAFLTGVMNIVPYVGPLIGGAVGVTLSLIIKYACATSYGLGVGFLPFVLILVAIFVFTQMVDNYVYQPLIYSNSVKVHPLEIFIVFLIAGQVGGMIGMLAAIPSYTVIRVIAKKFFSSVKAIRML